jgi:hypothetical protein
VGRLRLHQRVLSLQVVDGGVQLNHLILLDLQSGPLISRATFRLYMQLRLPSRIDGVELWLLEWLEFLL